MGDPGIKLFGRTIPAPAAAADPLDTGPGERCADEVVVKEVEEKETNPVIVEVPEDSDDTDTINSAALNSNSESGQPMITENDKGAVDSNGDQAKNANGASGQEKVLKKPDKILPCPRCSSMETKFCYYNNYNINQPRHFCKNCQRYWTAGGTMRNVPVGAGRRKSKSSSLQYRHIMMPPEGLVAVRPEAPVSAANQEIPMKPPLLPIRPINRNETVVKFGNEVPLCESVASVLKIEEPKKAPNGENQEERSCASSVTAANCLQKGAPESVQNEKAAGVAQPLPQCFVGGPFIYPWNNLAPMSLVPMMAGSNPSEPVPAAENCSASTTIPWPNPQMMTAPGFCPPGIPFPVMASSYWGCVPSWTNTMWNVPWFSSNACASPSSSGNNSSCSGSGSPTLGKHSRDSNCPGDEKKEKSLWVPKTLRIDDPEEAAKSSIWDTLGIKPCDRSIFKPFQSKSDGNGKPSEAAQVLQANPAALSRSQSFQESS